MNKRQFAFAAVATVAVVLLSSSVHAQEIRACVNSKGALRVLSASQSCKATETPLVWNVQGPQGANGTNGTNGTSVTVLGTFSGDQNGCPNGGTILGTANGNAYVCNGTNAVTGAASEVAVNTGNGFGSVGVYARRFLNVDVASGSDITYIQDAVYGDSFHINTTGIYAISDTDYSSPADTFSISLNSDPATEITFLQPGNRLCSSSMERNHLQNCTVTLKLDAGDVIRAHRSTGAIGAFDASPFVRFIIVRVW